MVCTLVLSVSYLPSVRKELTDYFISKVEVPAGDGQRSLVFNCGINAAKSSRILNLYDIAQNSNNTTVQHNTFTRQHANIVLWARKVCTIPD